jgi:glutamate dehydrogenase
MATLTETQTDTMLAVFPAYVDPFPAYVDPFDEIFAKMDELKATNKYVDQIIRTPGREPSPQPTHFSVSSHSHPHGQNGHRVLRSATVGYIAPKFEGKKAQMTEG